MTNMGNFRNYLRQIYRLALSSSRQEEIVWNELKQFHYNEGWKSGVYEKEKRIESIFEISNEKAETFYYIIYEGSFNCRVKIVEDFPSELTTELFILASHFNNILNYGVVIVNVNSCYVEYRQKRDLIIPLLYNDEIQFQLVRHYNISKDIYAAFQRLVIEQEAPAIIIADFLNNKENEDVRNA